MSARMILADNVDDLFADLEVQGVSVPVTVPLTRPVLAAAVLVQPRGTSAVTLLNDDCLMALRGMPDNSVDSVVTDPPYGLAAMPSSKITETMIAWCSGDRSFIPEGAGFMGRTWDAFVPPPAVWDEVFRVLKPGGYLLAFAGSRTQDLMGLSIRLSGFEIRDSIYWMYGSGFPKSMNVGKMLDKVSPSTPDAGRWQGWGTALKPAAEPIIVARKPLAEKTVAANVLTHGTGAMNIDASRIGTSGATKRSGQAAYPVNDDGTEDRSKSWARTGHAIEEINAGRFPANVILDEFSAGLLDEQSGILKSGGGDKGSTAPRRVYQQKDYKEDIRVPDQGGASRFFLNIESDDVAPFYYGAKAGKKERPVVDGLAHPTVKPLALMRYLIKLVTPPGGVVLEPFAGSGTTVEAAMLEEFDVIAVERDESYIPLIQSRIDRNR